MSSRELIALGTSSQVPTRERSHNAYMLRWDGTGFLFDPGEGAQRQLTLAGIPARAIHNICITHFHGDHCLGLAGILQRLSLDRCDHPVHLYYPAEGEVYIDRLRSAAVYQPRIEVVAHPVDASGGVRSLGAGEGYTLFSHPLEHSIATIGYRVEEPAGIHFLPDKLAEAGIHGPAIRELQRQGFLDAGGRTVRLEEVTEPRRGSVFAFIMDTRPCRGAIALARDADLVLMEATYTSEHSELADFYLHSTAAGAAGTAARANAHKLAIAHFSQRYKDAGQHLLDARAIFPETIALNDLDRVPIPRNLPAL